MSRTSNVARVTSGSKLPRTPHRKLSIQYRRIDELRLDPKNPRRHPEMQTAQIAASINAFGFIVPVLVDGKLNVIAGHGRVAAARILGLDVLPTIQLEHLSPAPTPRLHDRRQPPDRKRAVE